MTRRALPLISTLLIAFATPCLIPAQALSKPGPTTVVRLDELAATRSKAPTVKSMRAKVRKAQARAKAAVAKAKAAQAALDVERSQHQRSKRINIVLALVAVLAVLGMAIVGFWAFIWRREQQRAIKDNAELRRDLTYADRALEHQKSLRSDHAAPVYQAGTELHVAAAQRDNLLGRLKASDERLAAAKAEIATLKGEIKALEASAANRQIASAKKQIQVLKRAAACDDQTLAPKPLLNDDEQRLALLLRDWADENGVKLLAQVSMGEFLLAAKGELYGDLFRTYNSKRVDFLICNDDWSPRFVIEHFGGGHFGKGYAAQDEVKSRLLNLSGLGLVITLDEDLDHEILERVRRAHLSPASAVPACTPFERVKPPWRQGRTRTPSVFRSSLSG